MKLRSRKDNIFKTKTFSSNWKCNHALVLRSSNLESKANKRYFLTVAMKPRTVYKKSFEMGTNQGHVKLKKPIEFRSKYCINQAVNSWVWF